MSEILAFGFGMPAFQVGILGCLQAGRSYLFYAATIGIPEISELAFAVEVPSWKTLA